MQEPEALLPYNSSFGFLAANRPYCQLFLPDRAFPSFPFKCKLHTGQIRWNMHFFPPFLCPLFQLNSLLLGKRSGPQIIALVRLQCRNCENYHMIDSQENESHSTKAKSLHFSWQLCIDFSYACLKDTEFLRDAEADHDHSWKQCVSAYSPESQVELSCRAAGKDNVATLFVQCLLALWHFPGGNVTYLEYKVYRE